MSENVLYLPLKEKWYRMIESGEKKEEYREITPYWLKRLLWRVRIDADGAYDYETLTHFDAEYICSIGYIKDELSREQIAFRPFTHVHFTLGYPRKDDASRHMVKKIKEIVIAEGRPEWGSEHGKEYFVIKLED